MDTGAVFILSYLIQIPLALYALFKIPMRGQLSTPFENLRKNGIILFGILPCAFGSVAIQLVSLAVYMARVKSIEAGGNRADKAFTRAAGGSGSTSGNPFGGASSAHKPALAQENNPFGGGAPPSSPQTTESNPFASGSDPARPPENNPFGGGAPNSGPQTTEDNPFASGSDPARPPENNPFA